MTTCWFCGAENEEKHLFCTECGKSLYEGVGMRPHPTEQSAAPPTVPPAAASAPCDKCGGEIPDGLMACPKCGESSRRTELQKIEEKGTDRFENDLGAGGAASGPAVVPGFTPGAPGPQTPAPPEPPIGGAEPREAPPGPSAPSAPRPTVVEGGPPPTVVERRPEEPPKPEPVPDKSCKKCGKSFAFVEGMAVCPFCGSDLKTGEKKRRRVVESDPTQRWSKGIKDRAVLYHIKPSGEEQEIQLAPSESFIGRTGGQPDYLNFPMDLLLSARHARFRYEGRKLVVKDLDSLNGVYVRIREPIVLEDGQFVCMGEQVFRFERLDEGDAEPPPLPEDGAHYFGSGQEKSRARFVKILEDGSDGLEYHLSGLKCIFGRKEGHYVFAQDQLMSSQHTQVYERDDEFWIEDLRSTNGTHIRIREREIEEGTVLRIGEQTFRIDYV